MSMEQLTEAEIKALHTALDDEYLSWTTYDQVIRDFGEVANGDMYDELFKATNREDIFTGVA